MLFQKYNVEKLLRKFGHFNVTQMCTSYDVNAQLNENRDNPIAQSKHAQIIGCFIFE